MADPALGDAVAALPHALRLTIEPYHLGITTRDLEEAMAAFSDLLGLRWARIPGDVGDPATGSGTPRPERLGPETPSLGAIGSAISVGGPIRLELLQGTSDSVWFTTARATLHHYAFWVMDLTASVATMEADGWARELTMPDPSGRTTGFAYMTKAGAPRVELSDAVYRPNMAARDHAVEKGPEGSGARESGDPGRS